MWTISIIWPTIPNSNIQNAKYFILWKSIINEFICGQFEPHKLEKWAKNLKIIKHMLRFQVLFKFLRHLLLLFLKFLLIYLNILKRYLAMLSSSYWTFNKNNFLKFLYIRVICQFAEFCLSCLLKPDQIYYLIIFSSKMYVSISGWFGHNRSSFMFIRVCFPFCILLLWCPLFINMNFSTMSNIKVFWIWYFAYHGNSSDNLKVINIWNLWNLKYWP